MAAASIMATWHFLSDLEAETCHTEKLARLCDADLARARPPAAHYSTDGRGDMLSHLAALLLTCARVRALAERVAQVHVHARLHLQRIDWNCAGRAYAGGFARLGHDAHP